MKILLTTLKTFTCACFSLLCVNIKPNIKHFRCVQNGLLESSGGINITSHLDYYEDFKTAYFDNLTENYAINYKGSCGYIALAMLLSFYDTYLNDSIVPENYDVNSSGFETNMVIRRNSPGTTRDYINNANYLTAQQYLSYISTTEYTSLHSKLVAIGNTLGFYDINDNLTPCGTDYDDRLSILQYYLSNVAGLTINTHYSVMYEEYEDFMPIIFSNDVRSATIDFITDGYPVLLGINDGLGSGHVVVAYDYDFYNDVIYCHSGIDSCGTHVDVESLGFPYFFSALAINFYIGHNHPLNYEVSKYVGEDLVTDYYCFRNCKIHSYDGIKEHDYDYAYSFFSNTQHRAFCVCGAQTKRPHSISYESVFEIGNISYGVCIYCNDIIQIGNDLLIFNGRFCILPSGIIVEKKDDL